MGHTVEATGRTTHADIREVEAGSADLTEHAVRAGSERMFFAGHKLTAVRFGFDRDPVRHVVGNAWNAVSEIDRTY
jgi:hypothetical protein